MLSQPRCRMHPYQLPAEFLDDPQRRAELIIYRELANQLDGDWDVFYDVAWLDPVKEESPRDGQTDFVLVHRRFGILLLEVKGGGIAYDGSSRAWSSRDKTGEHAIDPINQVRKSKHALLDKLRSIPALKDVFINIYHCVAFPDVEVPGALPLDAPKEILIGIDELQYLKEKLESIFEFYKAVSAPQKNSELVTRLLSEMLSRAVIFPSRLGKVAEREEQLILKLTEQQYNILDKLNRNRRIAIGGCAGSGKTFLAVEKARRLANEGYRTLLTCFNRPLAEHLRTLTPAMEHLEVDNWHALCKRAAIEAGIDLPPFGKANNEGLDEKYAEALCVAMEQLPRLRYDAVIIDEGQDFDATWWVALEQCLNPNGILYVFYDDNQTLYKGRGTLPSNMFEVSLEENIRNSRPIFDQVERFYRNEDGTKMRSMGPDGRDIERITYADEVDLKRQISKTLSKLIMNEQVQPEDVAVLTPKRLDRTALLKERLPGPIQLYAASGYHENPPTRCKTDVLCSTIHSFKGLERKVVIVAELDEEFMRYDGADRDTRCYVGFSRAKNHLAIIAKEEVLSRVFLGR